jgi:5-methylcytosine-specific restriction endonuclease McrA
MAAKKQDPRVSAKYKAVRLSVLTRDSWTCFYCGHDVILLLEASSPEAAK